jgi:dinuclear metal center YbgI/SA1388 family protein
MTIAPVLDYLDALAPQALQEDYDNAGLLWGHPQNPCTGVYVVLDCLPERLAEAKALGCNLVVAHHPLIFKGLKKIDARHWVGQTLAFAIQHDIALFAIHTNLDNVLPGVNTMLAERIGLPVEGLKPLRPLKNALVGLTTFAPQEAAQTVLEALWSAGAGHIGQYAQCSFSTTGTGTFTPQAGAHPTLGQVGKPEQAAEVRLEVVLPAHAERRVLQALHATHPYEEVAYFLYPLKNTWQDAGAGAIGLLPEPVPFDVFCHQVCAALGSTYLRHTAVVPDKMVHKVAVCGGAGSFLLADAQRAGADVLVTGDVKHHEFLEATEATAVVDVGHYESEYLITEWLALKIREKFVTFAVHLPGPERAKSPVHLFTL